MKSTESPIIKIPILEMILQIVYNQGKQQNHFTHYGAKDFSTYLDQLK